MEGKIANLNLINQVKASTADTVGTGKPPGFYKSIVLDALGVLSALSVSYVYANYLSGAMPLTLLLAALGAFSVLSTLQVFFSENPGHRFSVVILEIGAMLAYFYNYDLKLLAASALIILIFQIWGFTSARNELKNGLKIRFFRASRLFLGKLATALALVLIILYSSLLNENTVFVSDSTFKVFFDWAAGLTGNFYPGINLSSSFGNFAESLAKLQLSSNQAFKGLPQNSQQTALNQASNQGMSALEEQLGIKISASEYTSNVFYRFIVKTLNDWRVKFQNWFGIAWLLVVFLIVRGFGSIFIFAVSLLSFVVYQVLLGSDFVHIVGEPAMKERIEF